MKTTNFILANFTLAIWIGLIPQNVEAGTISYEVIDLGFHATDINNHGQISGNFGDSGVFWDQSSGIQFIGNVGPEATRAYALNDSGQVVGSTFGGAFIWSATGGIQSLGHVGALGTTSSSTIARDINNQGQVVGTYTRTFGSGSTNNNSFLWSSSGGYRDLSHGNEDLGILNAAKINDSGVVLAETLNLGSFGSHSVVWDEINGKTNISYDLYKPRNITDSGLLVGAELEYSYSNGYGGGHVDHAALFNVSTNELTGLGRFGGRQSIAVDANEIGQVIGYSNTNLRLGPNTFESKAFIWNSQNGMQDLNALIEPSFGQDLRTITAINNLGQIIAGQYLLNPTTSTVSAGPSFAIFLIGLVMMIGQKKVKGDKIKRRSSRS